VFYGREQIDWLAQWIGIKAEQGARYYAVPPSLLRDIAEGVLLTVAFQL
jgi:cardiolipin synthase